MNVCFTFCSNNFLAQASVLRNSVKKFHPGIPLLLFLCDKKIGSIDYTLFADEVIEMESLEERFTELALKYNIVELNTCFRPRAFEYLFEERKYTKALYLDPDLKIFQPLNFLFDALDPANVLLTPHICTPIPPDGKTPNEQLFLMFGLYNMGLVGIRDCAESRCFLSWWKNWTYERGFMDTYKGMYVDQLPVNLAPLFFKSVLVLQDMGLNMAPWNLHERHLTLQDGIWYVNGNETLKFFHFSSFHSGRPELPQKHYNRFQLKDRPDLQPLYEAYAKELEAAGYSQYIGLPNAYADARKQQLRRLKKNKWIRKFRP